MKNKIYTGLLVLFILMLLTSCEETEPTLQDDLYPDMGLSSQDSLEAEVISFYLDQTLSASDSSLAKELFLLATLRETFRDSFPFVDSLRFQTPWVLNKIMLSAEDSVLLAMREGTLQNWGSLPVELQPDSVAYTASYGFGTIFLKSGYHPVLASEYYELIPGVEYAEAAHYFWTHGPSFALAIIRTGAGNQYLFRTNSSPYATTYYLFEIIDEEATFLGLIQSDSVAYNDFINEFQEIGNP